MTARERYYDLLIKNCQDYTVQGLFNGDRSIDKIQTLQTGNKGRIFFFDQEPIIAKIDQELWSYIFQQPTILANSELDSADKIELKKQYPKNFIDWYYFANALVAREWLSDYRYLYAGWSDYKTCLFDSNLITGYRQYRLYLLYLLIQDQSHHHCHISFNGKHNWRDDLKKYDHLNLLDIEDFCETIGDYHNSYDNFAKNNNTKNRLMQQFVSLEHYSQSNLVLVAETIFLENKKHLTEKIFKPIVAGKPFVLAGGHKNLEYLRGYGFETFSQCWNEDYDNIKDPMQRAKSVIDTVIGTALPNKSVYDEGIKDIKDYNRDFQQSLQQLQLAHDIAQNNRKHFWSDEFYNLLISEAVSNLERAKLELASKRV